jgi:hypothetical protein
VSRRNLLYFNAVAFVNIFYDYLHKFIVKGLLSIKIYHKAFKHETTPVIATGGQETGFF